jgi:hypothetical protein
MTVSGHNHKTRRLGLGAGVLMGLFARKQQHLTPKELHKEDFHPNTQKMGLRFTERMRNVFRLRWLRPK